MALLGQVEDSTLAARPLIGAIDQYADSTDLLGRPEVLRPISAVAHNASEQGDNSGA